MTGSSDSGAEGRALEWSDAPASAPSSAGDQLILVDESDHPIGQMSKAACHAGNGVLHRAFSLFILNGRDELLVQQRSDRKDLWPRYWSNSCCSHPRAGESMGAAIHRRLNEELGLSCTLQFLFKFRYQAQYDAASAEHELCSVFFGRSAEAVNANGEEIADWRWMGINEVQEELAGAADSYTPWFKLEWERIRRDHLGEVLSPGGMRTWASR